MCNSFIALSGPYLSTAAGEEFSVTALMREPRDWLGSWYRYRQRDDMSNPARSTKDMTFDEFVIAYCSDNPPEFANVGSQARFLHPKNGKGVDHLFRYDQIDHFVEFLEDRLGCEIILPRLNVSPSGETNLSAKTERKLQNFAANDFALYQSLPAS